MKSSPHCLGLPSVFSVDSNACNSCDSQEECMEKVIATLQAISQGVDVSSLLSQHLRIKEGIKLPPEDKLVSATYRPLEKLSLAKDVVRKPSTDGFSELAVTWLDECWKAGLRNFVSLWNENEVNLKRLRKTPPFVSCLLLSLVAGFCNRKELLKVLLEKTHLSIPELKEQFKAALQVLKALKIIKETTDDITLWS